MVDTGIRYESLVPELVPDFEQREAAVFCRYNWGEWQRLDWQGRASSIAHFRLHNLVELHKNDAIARDIKRKNPKVPGAR